MSARAWVVGAARTARSHFMSTGSPPERMEPLFNTHPHGAVLGSLSAESVHPLTNHFLRTWPTERQLQHGWPVASIGPSLPPLQKSGRAVRCGRTCSSVGRAEPAAGRLRRTVKFLTSSPDATFPRHWFQPRAAHQSAIWAVPRP